MQTSPNQHHSSMAMRPLPSTRSERHCTWLESYESRQHRETTPGPFIWLSDAAAAAIGGLLFGYDTGVISGVLVVIRNVLDEQGAFQLRHRALSIALRYWSVVWSNHLRHHCRKVKCECWPAICQLRALTASCGLLFFQQFCYLKSRIARRDFLISSDLRAQYLSVLALLE
jgi:hypothetical protein